MDKTTLLPDFYFLFVVFFAFFYLLVIYFDGTYKIIKQILISDMIIYIVHLMISQHRLCVFFFCISHESWNLFSLFNSMHL